jgi:hypothetical protein
MNIFKQWYLRLFKGYTYMPELDAKIVKLFLLGSNKKCDFISLNKGYLVSKPYSPSKRSPLFKNDTS